jgi:hypothetical protein
LWICSVLTAESWFLFYLFPSHKHNSIPLISHLQTGRRTSPHYATTGAAAVLHPRRSRPQFVTGFTAIQLTSKGGIVGRRR